MSDSALPTALIRVWPALDRAPTRARGELAALLATTLVGIVPGLAAIAWLAWMSYAQPSRSLPSAAVLLFVLHFGLSRMRLGTVIQAPANVAAGAVARLLSWSLALAFGPLVLWLDVVSALLAALLCWREPVAGQFGRTIRRWRISAALVRPLLLDVLPGLIGLTYYMQQVGAPSSAMMVIPAAVGATLLRGAATALALGPVVLVVGVMTGRRGVLLEWFYRFRLLGGWALALVILLLPDLLSLPLNLLLVEAGWWSYGALLAGVGVVLVTAHRAEAKASEESSEATKQRHLRSLSEGLSTASSVAELSELLAQFAPEIAPDGKIAVTLEPDILLYEQTLPAEMLAPATVGSIHVPVYRSLTEDGVVGSISWQPDVAVQPTAELFSRKIDTLRLLSRQLSTVLARFDAQEEALASMAEVYQSELYAELVKAEMSQAYERISQELAVAGRIQSSFLPRTLPDLPDWQLTAALEPARETSGDFYDVIPLADGHVGLVVADVADKGIGPALFGALSRTLIRTYALEYGMEPAAVLQAANRRIQEDSSSDLFVTVFFAVLDPTTGQLNYCNAGHNPPLWWPASAEEPVRLSRTALPLGLFLDTPWEQGQVQLQPGDLLCMYTDGIVEAEQNVSDGEAEMKAEDTSPFFGEGRLTTLLAANRGRPVEIVENKILTAVLDFVGDGPQADDITLLLLARDR
ncbi:MAG: PP2C family protein-serine/threonine phosphatase [Candidatus Promineifilaceae bacterium]|nr:PP2C family protein-serine/threonine phosphatase [Candidatus Promineifilaceae bacterium]